MASIRKQPKGNSWQLRVTARLNGERKRVTISLPELTLAQRDQWVSCVQSISDSIENNRPRERVVNEWLAKLSREHRAKLSDKGLIEPDEPVNDQSDLLLSEYLTELFDRREGNVKKSTTVAYSHTRKRLDEFFKGRTIKSISPKDAKDFERWLYKTNKRNKQKCETEAPVLADNTVRRRIGHCRFFFGQAIDDEIIRKNPFSKIVSNVRANRARQHYVNLDVFASVFAEAPNARWRLLLMLARVVAFRVPSEVMRLEWDHIDWKGKEIAIVASSKTEHHKARAIRKVPLFPQIERELEQLRAEAASGEPMVLPGIRGDSNLRTSLVKIINRAGVKQWPKLWQNLRSSGATDLVNASTPHIAAETCGHTEEIAREHYWTVSPQDRAALISKLSPEIDKALARKLAHNTGSTSPLVSPTAPISSRLEMTDEQKIAAFDSLSRLLSLGGINIQVAEAGLEPAQG